jgi:hypothetical protein
MCRDRLEKRVGPVVDHGAATLGGYTHRFSKPGNDGTAKGNIEVADGGRVRGVIYGLTAAQVESLSEFEGGYRRIQVVAALGASEVEAVAVVRPTAAYLGYYRRGIEEHGIELAYYESLVEELG